MRFGGPDLFTERTPRVAAARRLTRRKARRDEGAFLAEGPQAVREALAWAAERGGGVRELFATRQALDAHPDLIDRARDSSVTVSMLTDRAAAGLSETVTPQGMVAYCEALDVPFDALPAPTLVAVLVDVRDPGNAGTVLRTADAAGAAAVVFAGESVDPYNGKCVRASAGSLFHLAVVRDLPTAQAMQAVRLAGLRVLAATGDGDTDLFDLPDDLLAGPTAWVFGNEARGLRDADAARAEMRVRVPIAGRAESLNLAAAAAVCLYASARARAR